jgi:hypothetical protein
MAQSGLSFEAARTPDGYTNSWRLIILSYLIRRAICTLTSQTKIPSFPCAKVCSNLFLSKHMTIYSSVERHNTILSLGCIQRESRLCRIAMGSILFLEIIVHFHSGNCGCEEGRTCGVPSLDHLTPPIATHLVPHRHYR